MSLRHGFGIGGFQAGPHGYGSGYSPFYQWYPWVHLAAMAIMFVVIIVLFLVFWRKYNRRPLQQGQPMSQSQGATDPALAILQMRLAKGEISSEEYQKIKADLLS